MNYKPFHIVSLTPGTGARCLSPSLRASWRRCRTPPPLLLGLRALLYRPYQTRAQITMGDCYVLCGQPGVTWTALLHIVCDVSSCLSPQDVARRRFPRTRSPSGSGRQYLRCTSSRGGPFRTRLREPGKPGVSLRLFCSSSLSPRC